MLEVQRIDDQPVSLQIGQQEFEVEEETGYVTVPKEFLTGFRLSDIPADIIIKPIDKIEGHTIYITNDVAFSQFSGGSASAAVEEMLRRKFWDGDTGLSPYIAALRQATNETDEAAETEFDLTATTSSCAMTSSSKKTLRFRTQRSWSMRRYSVFTSTPINS